MSESATTRKHTTAIWQRAIWAGRGKPATRWRSLIGGVLALALAWISYTLMLSTIRWAVPMKLIGILLLLATSGLLFVAGRALLYVLLHIGIKRLLIRLGVLYALALVLVTWLVPSNQSGFNHVISSAGTIFAWSANSLSTLVATVLNTPADVSFAATGQRLPIRVPGIDWVDDVPPTPIIFAIGVPGSVDILDVPSPITPVAETETDGLFQIGDAVRVVTTGVQGLRVRDLPSRQGKILVKFAEGSIMQIVDGPQDSDGYTWWKVRRGSDEGWCAADFLAREP